MCFCYFFFQAEDGIRDLVRSRGLGDVYKRQVGEYDVVGVKSRSIVERDAFAQVASPDRQVFVRTVSYTHLTLPTSDLV